MILEELKELKELNWNNPYTNRQFELYDEESIRYLISNYRNDFAFGLHFKNKDLSILKQNNNIYIRNNYNFKFEFQDCKPPVTKVYELKSENVEDIVRFILN